MPIVSTTIGGDKWITPRISDYFIQPPTSVLNRIYLPVLPTQSKTLRDRCGKASSLVLRSRFRNGLKPHLRVSQFTESTTKTEVSKKNAFCAVSSREVSLAEIPSKTFL